jgi:hypothetical protein
VDMYIFIGIIVYIVLALIGLLFRVLEKLSVEERSDNRPRYVFICPHVHAPPKLFGHWCEILFWVGGEGYITV